MIDPAFGTLAFILGASVGSFLNVCIGRWPHDQSVVRPRSRCPRCGHEIAWFDNIPIVSWVLLRARCRGCALPISAQYPLVELVVGVLWLAAAWHYGPSLSALRVAVFATVMLGIAVTDARHYLIPDGFTVFGLLFLVVTSIVAVFVGDTGPFVAPFEALLGACAGAGAISIVGWLGEVVLKREAMGFGDVTLMAVVGAAVGPERSLMVLFLGAALGAVAFLAVVYPIVRLRATRGSAGGATRGGQLEIPIAPAVAEPVTMPEVPFGVFLAPAALVVLVWGEALVRWYLTQFPGV